MLPKRDLVTLVELPPTLYGELNGNPGYDMYTMFMVLPRALPTLAGVLKSQGFDVQMLHPSFHGEDGRLTQGNWDLVKRSQDVGTSVITRIAKQSMAFNDRCRQINPDVFLTVGGAHPGYFIEEWLEHVDAVVIGEGEKTYPELLKRVKEDRHNLNGIPGVAYKKNNEIIINPERELISPEEFGRLPLPFYDRQIIEKANIGVVEQERGCPHNCEYCSVTEIYGSKIRYFPIERVLDKIRQMQEYNLDPFFFSGDNLGGNPKHAIEMLEAIKDAGLSKYGRTAQVSVAAANNPRLLRVMRDTGIKHLCVGFEAVTDAVLKEFNKPFSAEQNTEAAKTFHEYGFWIHAMMMIGADSDNEETLRETKEWGKKYADSLQVSIIMPLPGTRFYKRMESEERILTKDWSLYDLQHCLIRPANFTPYRLQEGCFDMYREFYSPKESLKRLLRSPRIKISAATGLYASLGGLKKLIANPQTLQHLEFLKSVS